AAGLSVAIPAVLFHRFFERRVQDMVVHLEQESIKLVDELYGQRAKDSGESSSLLQDRKRKVVSA
ncbi:hypothetical protein ABMA58_12930, partial [Oceanospirillum sp. HFRX-1_2]